MKNTTIPIIFKMLFIVLFLSSCTKKKESAYTFFIAQEGKKNIEVLSMPYDDIKPFTYSAVIDSYNVSIVISARQGYHTFIATASPVSGEIKCFLGLSMNYTTGTPWNFNGEVKRTEVYRQSPHDVNAWITDSLAKQAVPMIALKTDSSFIVAVCNSPFKYNNYTTQHYDIKDKVLILNSGDEGDTPGMKPETMVMQPYNAETGQIFSTGNVVPYYHNASATTPLVFDGIIFNSNSDNLNNLRRDIIFNVADNWGNVKASFMEALAFSVPYMNLRVNDSKKSKYWVIPAVEYSNIQYCRDAFWISTMLSDTISAQCLENELSSINHYAEYPLYIPLWAYRIKSRGGHVDLGKVQKYLDVIEGHVKNGFYYSYDANDGRKDFQYWNDCIAFDTTDVITYNQGLFAVAMLAAEALGLKKQTSSALAIYNYRKLYNSNLGFYPLSMKKNILSPDPLTGDLLAYLLFNKHMLEKSTVESHFNSVVGKSKTPFGYKIVSDNNGNYLSDEQYNFNEYIAQVNKEHMSDGKYQKGGSWTLYDMLFLFACYSHGIEKARDEIMWRGTLDFSLGSTSYECINTVTGEPWKPNMGWNSAIYYIYGLLFGTDNQLLESINSSVK